MKKRVIIISVIILVIILSYSFLNGRVVITSKAELNLSQKQWLEDLNFLQTKLPQKHKNLFFNLTKDKFNAEVDALKKDLPSLSGEETAVRLKQIVASVGDGHTRIQNLPQEKIYPVVFYWLKDGIYLLAVDRQYENSLGNKLLSINNKPVDEIMSKLKALVAATNESSFKDDTPGQIQDYAAMKYLKIVDTEKATFTLQRNNGETYNVDLLPMKQSEIKYSYLKDKLSQQPLYRKSNSAFWSETLDNGKVIYMQYSSCVFFNDKKEFFPSFYNKLINTIKKTNPEKLIVDLRFNGGGNSLPGTMFVKKLAKTNMNKEGKLFVLVGRKTFSSAMLNTLDFQNYTKAKFYGEPTSASPNHYGEVKTMVLPNSKLAVSYSTKYFKDSKDDSPTFTPDKVIEVSSDDYKDGRDPVLEEILKVK